MVDVTYTKSNDVLSAVTVCRFAMLVDITWSSHFPITRTEHY